MSDRIEAGDKVDVFFERNAPIFYAEVLYTPQATGDAFHLKTENGHIVYVQNYSIMERLIRGGCDGK